MKRILLYLSTLLLIFILIACTPKKIPTENENSNPNQEETQKEEETPVEPPIAWDKVIQESIELEGMKEPLALNLYEGFNFKTYVPEDFLVESLSSGEGDGYWFYANYENKKVEDVYLHLFFFPETIKEEPSIEDKNSLLYHMLPNMNVIDQTDKVDEWAINEYKNPNGGEYAMLGKHGDRYFTMTLRYPGEYAEGFVPRANKIIDHLYWTDTNEYLVER